MLLTVLSNQSDVFTSVIEEAALIISSLFRLCLPPIAGPSSSSEDSDLNTIHTASLPSLLIAVHALRCEVCAKTALLGCSAPQRHLLEVSLVCNSTDVEGEPCSAQFALALTRKSFLQIGKNSATEDFVAAVVRYPGTSREKCAALVRAAASPCSSSIVRDLAQCLTALTAPKWLENRRVLWNNDISFLHTRSPTDVTDETRQLMTNVFQFMRIKYCTALARKASKRQLLARTLTAWRRYRADCIKKRNLARSSLLTLWREAAVHWVQRRWILRPTFKSWYLESILYAVRRRGALRNEMRLRRETFTLIRMIYLDRLAKKMSTYLLLKQVVIRMRSWLRVEVARRHICTQRERATARMCLQQWQDASIALHPLSQNIADIRYRATLNFAWTEWRNRFLERLHQARNLEEADKFYLTRQLLMYPFTHWFRSCIYSKYLAEFAVKKRKLLLSFCFVHWKQIYTTIVMERQREESTASEIASVLLSKTALRHWRARHTVRRNIIDLLCQNVVHPTFRDRNDNEETPLMSSFELFTNVNMFASERVKVMNPLLENGLNRSTEGDIQPTPDLVFAAMTKRYMVRLLRITSNEDEGDSNCKGNIFVPRPGTLQFADRHYIRRLVTTSFIMWVFEFRLRRSTLRFFGGNATTPARLSSSSCSIAEKSPIEPSTPESVSSISWSRKSRQKHVFIERAQTISPLALLRSSQINLL